MKKFIIRKMLKSKKFWYSVAAVLAPIIASACGVPESEVYNYAYPIIALIIGQGIADNGKEAKRVRRRKRRSQVR